MEREKTDVAMDCREEKYSTINTEETGKKIVGVLAKKKAGTALDAKEKKIEEWTTNAICLCRHALKGDACQIKLEHKEEVDS